MRSRLELRRWGGADVSKTRRGKLETARRLAQDLSITPNEAARHGLALNRDGVRRSAYDLLAYPDHDLERLAGIWPELGTLDAKTAEALEIEARYAVYLGRQRADIAMMEREEALAIPADLSFDSAPGLSNELKYKIRERRPRSIAEAQRIDGMTPAALALMISEIRRQGGSDGVPHERGSAL